MNLKHPDEDCILLSALQHYVFCPRQCGLIHLEDAWQENLFTAEGRVMHEKVHDIGFESRGKIRVERNMLLESQKYGLRGKVDVVEFHLQPDGNWLPFPVEYKRGKPKNNNSDKVQLCAQALCLEEITGERVEKGALFYGKTKKRMEVCFDKSLRVETIKTIDELRQMLALGVTPKAVYSSKCKTCSLNELCLPKIVSRAASVNSYLDQAVKEACENI